MPIGVRRCHPHLWNCQVAATRFVVLQREAFPTHIDKGAKQHSIVKSEERSNDHVSSKSWPAAQNSVAVFEQRPEEYPWACNSIP